MVIKKKDCLKALEKISLPGQGSSITESGAIKNIAIFANDIVIDIAVSNPTLHTKKRIEKDITEAIVAQVSPMAKLKINFLIEKHAPPESIKGKPINGIKNIIAISSGKGGVGKSTITANLAVSLAKMGFKVGILDADIYGPSIPIMFDVENAKPISVNIEGKSKMQPIESYGVKLLSIGFFTKVDQAVIWRGPMAAKALNQMIFDANWGELDFLLVDLPPGTGDIHLSIMQSLPLTGAVVVSTPQTIALADAKKGVSMFKNENINVPVLGIIENMAYFTPEELPENKYYIFGKNGAKNLAEDLNVPVLGQIPIVQSIRESSDIGRPAALQKDTLVESAFTKMSQNTISELVKRNKTLPKSEAIKITTMAGCNPKN